ALSSLPNAPAWTANAVPGGAGAGAGGTTSSGTGRTRALLPSATTVRVTGTTPSTTEPISAAAAFERSTMRPATDGPRSLILTRTVLPFFSFMTSTIVPSGRERWAAEIFSGLKISPLAVGRFANSAPYQEASPRCCSPVVFGSSSGGRVDVHEDRNRRRTR